MTSEEDIELWKRVDHRLTELVRMALEKYIKEFGVDWIWDWIGSDIETEILKQLTPHEQSEYQTLLTQYHNLSYKIWKRSPEVKKETTHQ